MHAVKDTDITVDTVIVPLKLKEILKNLNNAIDHIDSVKEADLTQGADPTAETLRLRKEYQDFWKLKLKEQKIYDALGDPGETTHSPHIRELIGQEGLQVPINRQLIATLIAKGDSTEELIKNLNFSPVTKYATMLANLSYAYVLMAQNYKIARDHVTAVVSEKTLAEGFATVGLDVLKTAVLAALSAFSGGVTGVLATAMIKSAGLGQKQDDQTEEKSIHDQINGQNLQVVAARDGLKPVATEVTNVGVQAVVGTLRNIGGTGGFIGRATQLLNMDVPENSTQDPYEYFMDKEAQLRRVAAFINSWRLGPDSDPGELGRTLKVNLDREYTLEELEQSESWKFLFQSKSKLNEIEEIWSNVQALLSVYMRRFCWQMFCRGQWNNQKDSYTITVGDFDTTKWDPKLPATEWNYKVWVWAWGTVGIPRHWAQMCSDFKGPEHNPDHKFTIEKGLVPEAERLLKDNAWISMVAVYCCQVRRFGGGLFSNREKHRIDLLKIAHYGKEEGEQLSLPSGIRDHDLLYGQIGHSRFENKHLNDKRLEKQNKCLLEEFLEKIRPHTGTKVQIDEIRFGMGRLSQTGKKGRIRSSNSPDAPEAISDKLKIQVNIKRTSNYGNTTTSWEKTIIGVYRANQQTHERGKSCETKAGCWYCHNATSEEKTTKDFQNKRKLILVDKQEESSWLFTALSRKTFPSGSNTKVLDYRQDWNHVEGLYCVILDPQIELQGADASRKEHHVTDEWWFKINKTGASQNSFASDPTDLNEQTTIATGLVKAYSEISGRWIESSEGQSEALINVLVNGQPYGHTKPTRPTPPNSTPPSPCTWIVKGRKLYPGDVIEARATIPATKDVPMLRSKVPARFLKKDLPSPELPTVLQFIKPHEGDMFVSLLSTVAESSKIEVEVVGHVGKYPATRIGYRFNQDADDINNVAKMEGAIRWEVGPFSACLLGGDRIKATAASDFSDAQGVITSYALSQVIEVDVERSAFYVDNIDCAGIQIVKGISNAAEGTEIVASILNVAGGAPEPAGGAVLKGARYDEATAPAPMSGAIEWEIVLTRALNFGDRLEVKTKFNHVNTQINHVNTQDVPALPAPLFSSCSVGPTGNVSIAFDKTKVHTGWKLVLKQKRQLGTKTEEFAERVVADDTVSPWTHSSTSVKYFMPGDTLYFVITGEGQEQCKPVELVINNMTIQTAENIKETDQKTSGEISATLPTVVGRVAIGMPLIGDLVDLLDVEIKVKGFTDTKYFAPTKEQQGVLIWDFPLPLGTFSRSRAVTKDSKVELKVVAKNNHNLIYSDVTSKTVIT